MNRHIPTPSRQRSFIKPKRRDQVDSFGKSAIMSPVGISSTDLILVPSFPRTCIFVAIKLPPYRDDAALAVPSLFTVVVTLSPFNGSETYALASGSYAPGGGSRVSEETLSPVYGEHFAIITGAA